MARNEAILVVNCGSSSVKLALFDATVEPVRLMRGEISGIGTDVARCRADDGHGRPVEDARLHAPDHAAALTRLDDIVRERGDAGALIGIGHRVVHGGAGCDCPREVDDALLDRLGGLVPLAPLHLPHNIAGIAAMRERFPDVPQLACFDTAFHEALPDVARATGLPPAYTSEGVRRYGFHGLSYEFVVDDLLDRHGDAVLAERLIVAHLGGGASMAAIRNGRSVETTMGFSALGGLPMGTRSGDLDPGIVLYLAEQQGMEAGEVTELLYKRSGLFGMSGLSPDMRVLLAERAPGSDVDLAIRYFCHRARWYIGALAACMDGLDKLVFTGGIGANSPPIRAEICAGLKHLGVELDRERNAAPEPAIAAERSRVAVEAVATDEERMIARHVRDHITVSKEA